MAGFQVDAPIVLNGNELQGAVFENLSALPTAPYLGQHVFFLTSATTGIHIYWSGTAWVRTDALWMTKAAIGLGSVDNTSDVNKPISAAQQTALDSKQPLSSSLTNLASLGDSPVISQLSGAFDATLREVKLNKQVLTRSSTGWEFADAIDPTIISSVVEDRFDGIDSQLANKQGLNTYLTAISGLSLINNDILQYKSGALVNRTPVQLKADLGLVKADVGLDQVNNTSDSAKPISLATQSALNGKADIVTTVTLTGAQTLSNKTLTSAILTTPNITSPVGLVKADVGLDQVDNTSDINKPISTAVQNALNNIVVGNTSLTNAVIGNSSTITVKDTNFTLQDNLDITKQAKFELGNLSSLTTRTYTVPNGSGVFILDTLAQTLTNKTLTSPVITTPTGIVKGDVGLANVDNTSDVNKPISTATQTALNLKANDSATVHLTGNETIAGIKTFSSTIAGSINGNAATVTTNANLTGDVTSVGNATTIANLSADKIISGTNNHVFTAAMDTKLAGIATAATANSTDAYLLSRTNHTGTQLAATISDFSTAVDARITAETIHVLKTGSTMTGLLTTNAGITTKGITVQDTTDATKQFTWALSGITTGNTRTYTAPNASGTVVLDTFTQTLTNKTLDNTNTVTLKDNVFTIQDDVDNTKQSKFDNALITTGTTNTYKLPANSGTLALLNDIAAYSLVIKSGTYNMAVSDQVVLHTGGGAIVTLPAPATVIAGRPYIIKSISGSNGSINVHTAAGLIDGSAVSTISNLGAKQYVSDNVNWYVF